MYHIRQATAEDGAALARLSEQELGYHVAPQVASVQFKKILGTKGHVLLVAEDENAILGYVHASEYDTLYAAPLYNLLGMAVSHQHQHRGIGRQLLQALEAIAIEENKAGIRVNSGSERKSAHLFYEKMGYKKIKEQLNFRKELRDNYEE